MNKMNNLEKNSFSIKSKRSSSIDFLNKLAELGKKAKLKGPKDAVKNFDKYLWDNYKV